MTYEWRPASKFLTRDATYRKCSICLIWWCPLKPRLHVPHLQKQKDPQVNKQLAKCVGHDPRLFDDPQYATAALQICDTCTVRDWCLNLVDPARSYFDGVAGGHTWKEGRLLCKSCLDTDRVLIVYMATRPTTHNNQYTRPE